MKINFIFLLGCMIACLLFLSCSVGDKSNSQVTEASALTSNVQENKSEQETKTAKEANSVQGNLGLELSQTHFTHKPQVVTLTITTIHHGLVSLVMSTLSRRKIKVGKRFH